MRTITITAELTYDAEMMHGDELDATDWFYSDILFGDNLLLHDNGEIGDTIGKVKMLHLDYR